MASPSYDLLEYAFYNDGTESGSTIIGSSNSQQTLDVDTTYLVRFQIQNDNSKNAAGCAWTFEFNHAGGGWTDVSTSAAAIQAVDSSSLTEGADCTNRLTNQGANFISDNNGVTEDGVTTSYNHGPDLYLEVLLAFQIPNAQVSNEDEILIRARETGNGYTTTYTVTGDINVSEIPTINAAAGALSLSGQQASIDLSLTKVNAAAGALTLSGQGANILIPTELAITNLGSSANPDINDPNLLSSYSNSSWTPPTTGAIVLFVNARDNVSTTRTPTVSGNSLTWVQIGSTLDSGGSGNGMSMFIADASGATTGQTTINFGFDQVHCSASFFQVTGLRLISGPANAVAQNVQNTGTTGTEATVTLAAASGASNRPISFVWHNENEGVTERSGWTEIDELTGSGQSRGINTQYKLDKFETTASGSWASSPFDWGIFAAELISKQSRSIDAAAGALTLSGQQATIDAGEAGVNISGNAGALTLSGQQATIVSDIVISASAGALSITGQAATVDAGGAAPVQINANAGSLSISGQAASIKSNIVLPAGAGSISLAGQAATIVSDIRRVANSGTLSLTGQQATIISNIRITASSGSLTLSGQAATITAGSQVAASAGSIILSGQAATIKSNIRRVANQGALSLTGLQATVNAGAGPISINASAGALTLSGQQATIKANIVVTSNPGSVSLTGQQATIKANVRITASQGSLSVAGLSATIRVDIFIYAAVGALDITGQQGNITAGTSIGAFVAALVLAGQQASVKSNILLPANIGSLSLTAPAGQIVPGPVAINASVGALSLAGLTVTIFALLFPNPDNAYYATYEERRLYILFRDKRDYVKYNDDREDS